jgi:flagellar protein FlbT
MALKISLKPREKLILGGAVITNGENRCDLVVENPVTILRQNNIISPDEADTPARRVYLAIQLMYIDPQQLQHHQKIYWQLVKDFLDAAPSALGIIDEVNELIFREKHYEALKSAKRLIDFEQEVIERVAACT